MTDLSEPPLESRGRQWRGDELIIVRQRQHAFGAAVLSVLVNVCILNFFVEHVDEVVIDSFSISVLTAILLTAMVSALSRFEHRVSHYFGRHSGVAWRIAGFLSVWGILFLGKFLILEVVDLVFGDHVELGHLLEVILLVLVILIVQRLMAAFYTRLGQRWGDGEDDPPTRSLAT